MIETSVTKQSLSDALVPAMPPRPPGEGWYVTAVAQAYEVAPNEPRLREYVLVYWAREVCERCEEQLLLPLVSDTDRAIVLDFGDWSSMDTLAEDIYEPGPAALPPVPGAPWTASVVGAGQEKCVVRDAQGLLVATIEGRLAALVGWLAQEVSR